MILKYEQERDKKLVFTIIDRNREIMGYVFFNIFSEKFKTSNRKKNLIFAFCMAYELA